MKKNKLSMLFIVLVMILLIQGSYTSFSRYSSTAEGETEILNIAKWSVELNDDDITTKSTIDENIQINVFQNSKIANGKFAPGSEGYFDIKIDTSAANVASYYKLEIDQSNFENWGGWEITGYQVDEQIDDSLTNVPSNLYYKATAGTINGTILLDGNNGKEVNLRVYLKWNNDSANNDAHVNMGKNAGKIVIPMTVTVEQFWGQEITQDVLVEN